MYALCIWLFLYFFALFTFMCFNFYCHLFDYFPSCKLYCLFVLPGITAFTISFIHPSFIHYSIHLLIHSCIHSFFYLFINPFVSSSISLSVAYNIMQRPYRSLIFTTFSICLLLSNDISDCLSVFGIHFSYPSSSFALLCLHDFFSFITLGL